MQTNLKEGVFKMKTLEPMTYQDGFMLYEFLKAKGRDVRVVVWETVTHIYMEDRYLDTFYNKDY